MLAIGAATRCAHHRRPRRTNCDSPDNWTQSFEIDSFRKQCLLTGSDDISLTLRHEPDIAAYERRAEAHADWL